MRELWVTAIITPVLGGAIIAGGNIGTDYVNGTLSGLNGVGDWATHLALTGLEATGAGAAGSLAKGGFNLAQKWGWTNFNRIVPLGADDIALTLATAGGKPSFNATVQTVAAKVSSQQIVKSVASGVANVAKGGGKVAKTLPQQADDLVRLNGGRNSVTLRTPTKQIRYDLAGKAHKGVPTPHKQIYKKNFFRGQVRSITKASKDAIPMTQQELRIIRKYLIGLK